MIWLKYRYQDNSTRNGVTNRICLPHNESISGTLTQSLDCGTCLPVTDTIQYWKIRNLFAEHPKNMYRVLFWFAHIVVYIGLIYFICPNSIILLWPNDAIWRQKSGSTLVHVMTWCLTALNYHKGCYVAIIWGKLHKTIHREPVTKARLKKYLSKISFKSTMCQCVIWHWICDLGIINPYKINPNNS